MAKCRMLTAVAFAAQASPARPAGKRSTPVCVWQVCVGPAAAIAAAPAPWPPRCDVDMYFIREKMRECVQLQCHSVLTTR